MSALSLRMEPVIGKSITDAIVEAHRIANLLKIHSVDFMFNGRHVIVSADRDVNHLVNSYITSREDIEKYENKIPRTK